MRMLRCLLMLNAKIGIDGFTTIVNVYAEKGACGEEEGWMCKVCLCGFLCLYKRGRDEESV